MNVKALSCIQLFTTPWTVAYQASPSMGFSRQEYWSGLPFPSPGDLSDPGIEPLPTQGLNPDLPHCRQSFTIWATREVYQEAIRKGAEKRFAKILIKGKMMPKLIELKWKVLVAQLCLTLCNLMDFSPPSSLFHGIFHARLLEWAAIPFSRGSSTLTQMNQYI